MPKYMLVLRDDPSVFTTYGPGDMQRILETYNAWSGRMAQEGRLVRGHKLTDQGGRTMKKSGGRVVTKDGPFVETKEIVSGYFIIAADSYDHAVKLCADHPVFSHDGTLEIREVDFMGGPEE
ncbi:MAG TPA: YciI family protein [Planctomycetota bacterium]|nr:YciI family protein [Planctomycetota bacterium]